MQLRFLDFLNQHPVILKPLDGYDGMGVNKIECSEGQFVLNGKPVSEKEILDCVAGLDGYVMQE